LDDGAVPAGLMLGGARGGLRVGNPCMPSGPRPHAQRPCLGKLASASGWSSTKHASTKLVQVKREVARGVGSPSADVEGGNVDRDDEAEGGSTSEADSKETEVEVKPRSEATQGNGLAAFSQAGRGSTTWGLLFTSFQDDTSDDSSSKGLNLELAETALTAMTDARTAAYEEFQKQVNTRLTTAQHCEERIREAIKERDQAIKEAKWKLVAQLHAALNDAEKKGRDLEASNAQNKAILEELASVKLELKVSKSRNEALQALVTELRRGYDRNKGKKKARIREIPTR